MPETDLNAVAERARAAGKSAAEFVRWCFEEGPKVAKTPTPAGPVPIPYPNVAVASRAGMPQIAVGAARPSGFPTGPSATEALAEADAILVGLMRAVITGKDQVVDAVLKMMTASHHTQERVTGLSGARSTSREDALLQLLAALRNAYGLDFKAAVVAVLNGAGRTFGWRLNSPSAAAVQPVVEFTVRVVQAGQRAFAMTAELVRRELSVLAARACAQGAEAAEYAAASTMLALVIVIIMVIICILVSIATFGAGPAAVAAIAGASVGAIAAAVAAAFAAGATAAVVVCAIVSILAGRAGDAGEAVCRGWSMATQRPPVGELVRALRQVLGLTMDAVADVLRRCGCLDAAAIASALAIEFGRDANLIARALRAAGAGAGDVASALRSANFSADDVGRALKDEYGLASDQVTVALQNAGYSANQVSQVIANLFNKVGDAAESVVRRFL